MTQQEKDNLLFDAITEKSLEKVAKAIRSGANINARDRFNNAVIFKAYWSMKPEILEYVIKQGADLTATTKEGYTVFGHILSRSETSDSLFERILVKYCDLSAPVNKRGDTALHLLAKNGNWQLVKYCLSKGVDIHILNNFKDTPLHSACIGRSIVTVKILLENGANIYKMNGRNQRPYDMAIAHHSLKIASVLAQYELDKIAKAKTVDNITTI